VSAGTIDIHHDRHPADHSVPIRPDAEQPASGRRLFKLRKIVKHVREADQVGPGIGAEGGEGGFGQRLGRTCIHRVGARAPEHHASPADRIGENLVVARQLQQSLPRGFVHVAKMRHGLVGGRAVRFGKNHIERDRRGLQLVQTGQQISEDRPRPGPLPIGAHAFLVDIDDHDGADVGHSRADVLIEVEASKPELLERLGIPRSQQEEDRQQQKAKAPPRGESLQ
jgi:hypothetical protein